MEDFFAYRLIIGVIQGVHLSPLGFAACQSKKCTPLVLSDIPNTKKRLA